MLKFVKIFSKVKKKSIKKCRLASAGASTTGASAASGCSCFISSSWIRVIVIVFGLILNLIKVVDLINLYPIKDYSLQTCWFVCLSYANMVIFSRQHAAETSYLLYFFHFFCYNPFSGFFTVQYFNISSSRMPQK